MTASKEWSVLEVTYPRLFKGEPHTLKTPSKQTFQRRFSIIDPFQKPYLAGHDVVSLDAVIPYLESWNADH